MSGPLFDPVREDAWESWHREVILGSDTEAVSHEAFCAGWEAERERVVTLLREKAGDLGGRGAFGAVSAGAVSALADVIGDVP
jgi:hypothetical protein